MPSSKGDVEEPTVDSRAPGKLVFKAHLQGLPNLRHAQHHAGLEFLDSSCQHRNEEGVAKVGWPNDFEIPQTKLARKGALTPLLCMKTSGSGERI